MDGGANPGFVEYSLDLCQVAFNRCNVAAHGNVFLNVGICELITLLLLRHTETLYELTTMVPLATAGVRMPPVIVVRIRVAGGPRSSHGLLQSDPPACIHRVRLLWF